MSPRFQLDSTRQIRHLLKANAPSIPSIRPSSRIRCNVASQDIQGGVTARGNGLCTWANELKLVLSFWLNVWRSHRWKRIHEEE
jgi:hypothetical protein